MSLTRSALRLRAQDQDIEGLSRLTFLSSASGTHLTFRVMKPHDSLGDQIHLALDTGEGPIPLFMGKITTLQEGHAWKVYTAEPFPQIVLQESIQAQSFRKETPQHIAKEILTGKHSFGIKISDWPTDPLPRFSFPTTTRGWALQALENVLFPPYGTKTARVVDAAGDLYLGPPESIRQPGQRSVKLETKNSIIRRQGGRLITLAVPLAYNQKLLIDEKNYLCLHSQLTRTAGRSQSTLEVEAL